MVCAFSRSVVNTLGQTVQTDANQPLPVYAEAQSQTSPPGRQSTRATHDVPIHGERTNVLFHPTPTITLEPMFSILEFRASMVCLGIAASTLIVGTIFGSTPFWITFLLAAGTSSGVYLWMKEVIRSGREFEWSAEKKRGEVATVNLVPESAEWMNSFLKIIWRLVNPELFAGVVDTLEDVMQASVPKVIENVRVADMHQGSNPIRILSLRSLPDGHMEEIKHSIRQSNARLNKDPEESAAEEEGGDFYNFEASFAYHAAPTGERTSDKARNMHIQLVFYLGIKGLFGIPIPIFVELQRLVGTVRMRINLTPQPPFLKTLTFTFMGLPHIQVGCVPMVERGVNILNLPLISNFVQMAIRAATNMYVAPRSLTLDLAAILQGDDILKDTDALGILWVNIKRAADLSKQDRRGSKDGGSDPYITLTFSKYGKPMWCSRVITDDLNPVWEESTALLVTPELIRARENLSVELWDSDRHTADDVVGKVEYSIRRMMRKPGLMRQVTSTLKGVNADSSMPGELYWEVGYFPKAVIRPEMRTSPYVPAPRPHFGGDDKDSSKKNEPRESISDDNCLAEAMKEMNDSKSACLDDPSSETEPVKEAVLHTPPDPIRPSGIFHIVIHQIVNLQLENIKGSVGNRKGREYEPAKSYGETTEQEGKELPTSYCTILMNDELVYRTRSKPVSSSPIFNAGTERFIRDWRSAIATVTVRDQRNREHDPILGVVPLKLSDIFSKRSQVTRWYPLDGGIGFGRIRISLLFRSVDVVLPPQMLGWDVGTVEFMTSGLTATGYNNNASLKVHTGGRACKVQRSLCSSLPDGSGVHWDITGQEKDRTLASEASSASISTTDNVSVSPILRLPVRHRYRSPVVFEFRSSRSKLKADAYSIIWLDNLVDNEDTPVDIAIWRTKNPSRLLLNRLTDDELVKHCRTGSGLGSQAPSSQFLDDTNIQAAGEPLPPAQIKGVDDLEIVGRLQFRCRFKAGFDESHEPFIRGHDDRETFETWEACVAEGVRERVVKKEMSDTVKNLHERSQSQQVPPDQAGSQQDQQDEQRPGTGSSGSSSGTRGSADSQSPRSLLGQDDPRSESRANWIARDGTDWSHTFASEPFSSSNPPVPLSNTGPQQLNAESRASTGSASTVTRPRSVHSPLPPLPESAQTQPRGTVSSAVPDSDSESSYSAIDSADEYAGMARAGSSNRRACRVGTKSQPAADDDESSSHPDRGNSSFDSNRSPTEGLSTTEKMKKTLERKHRGAMQWRPIRNAKFAKDGAVIGIRKLKDMVKGGLDGRTVAVESEAAR